MFYTDSDKLKIAKRISELRSAKKITQEKMAELIDVSYATYMKIEHGGQNLTIRHLFNISRVLEISTDILLFGEIDKANDLNFDEYITLSEIFDEEALEETAKKILTILKIKRAKK